MGWEGWAPPMFLTGSKNHSCCLEFFFERFSFRISYLKDVELNNFCYLSYMFFRGYV